MRILYAVSAQTSDDSIVANALPQITNRQSEVIHILLPVKSFILTLRSGLMSKTSDDSSLARRATWPI